MCNGAFADVAGQCFAAGTKCLVGVWTVYRDINRADPGKRTFAQCDIGFFKMTRKQRSAIGIKRADNDTGRTLIEPSDSPERAAVTFCLKMPRYAVGEGVGLMPVRRMNGDVGTFVDNQKVVVLIKYIKRYLNRLNGTASVGKMDGYNIACVNRVDGADFIAVSQQRTLGVAKCRHKSV